MRITDIYERSLSQEYQQLRLYDLLITTYIGRIINVSVDGIVNRTTRRRNISLHSNSERIHFTRRVITVRQSAGLRMMQLIKLYGWGMLLSEIVSTSTMTDVITGDLSTLEVNDYFKRRIDAIISPEDARNLVLQTAQIVAGREFVTEIMRRIDEGINYL